jgi:hypothetical protein
MFLAFPWLMSKIGFWLSLLVSVIITALCFVALALVMKRFGVSLV